MEFRFVTPFAKRAISLLLVLSIIAPPFYMAKTAPKAHAFWGIADTTVDIPAWADRLIDGVSMAIAQTLIDHMVASTVKWAQSGFEGNPAYVTNPKQFFTNVADGAAIEFLRNSSTTLGVSSGVAGKINKGLDLLCSPFQANIRLSLQQQYYEPEPFQCTLSEVAGNIEGFYSNFSQGGWDAWFSMTQNPTNNPYGAYLGAKIEMDSRIAEALNIEKEKLDWSGGFMSWSECIMEDPMTKECLARDPEVKTPGSVIKSGLDNVLPSGLNKLISAQHIDQLVSGFASGLLNKYVFGSKGLFAKRSRPGATTASASTNTSEAVGRASEIDLDNDGIPDGQDADHDDALISRNDVCFHGGSGTPNSPCKKSSEVPTSPYFTPVCEAIDRSVLVMTDYAKYIDTHAGQIEGGASLAGQFIGNILGGPVGVVLVRTVIGGGSADNFKNKADAELWGNRTSAVDAAIGEVINSIQSRNSPYFDNMEIATNRFANYTGRVFESLMKDNDLDLKGLGRSGGGGLENLMKQTAYNLKYLQEAKSKMGKCSAPNAQAIAAITLPPPVEENIEPGGGGGECDASSALPMPGGSAPDMSSIVRDVASEFPQLLASSGQNMDFLDRVVERLHAADSNWGYNGKRGNGSDLSKDAIAYLTDDPRNVHIFDVIAGHGGPNPTPSWQDQTAATYGCGTIGLYVYPR